MQRACRKIHCKFSGRAVILNALPVNGAREILALRSATLSLGRWRNASLVPLYKLFDERYTVYWKVNRKTA